MPGRTARDAIFREAEDAGIRAAASNHRRYRRHFTRLDAARPRPGVRELAPRHCTGEAAIALFRAAWGDDFVEGGCGAVIALPGTVFTNAE